MREIKAFVGKYLGAETGMQVRIFRWILIFGVIAIFFGTLFNAIVLKDLMSVVTPLFMEIMAVITLILSIKLKNTDNLFFVVLLAVNCLFCPVIFFQNGGMNSAVPQWFLLGIVMVFFFLKSWRLYLALALSLLVECAVYLVAVLRPEWVVTLNAADATLASGLGVLIVGLFLGTLLMVQRYAYEKEKEISEQRNQEIRDISDSKSLFFANMSHEIRTPINTIIGLNEMILREEVSEEVAENAINIQNASKMLLALINDILDMSKLESGKMEIVPAQYETASLFSDLVNIIWIRANQKGLEFKIDIAEDIPSMLYGDEVRIKQILTNILTNAVKYTEKGSVTLTVSGEQTGENVMRLTISVEDTGIGIKKESLEELFTVFKRVDQQKTKKIEGTGLGLAISKQLVEMMGGTIKVDSIYQKGSNFTVTLDQQIINLNPIGSMRYAMKRGTTQRERYERSFEAPEAHILVVDDNEMNLLVAKKLLRDTKVQVDLAVSGEECLAKTLEHRYHMILMDHLMPGMDGEQTLQTLRSRQEGYCQKTPVIALTANVMTNASAWYQKRGFDGYLAKPVNGALLEAVLMKFLPRELMEYGEETGIEERTPDFSDMVFHKNKKKIAVCAECVCDLPQEWIEEQDIRIMYYYVMTEEGRFVDTKEIGSLELVEYMESGKRVTSSAAPQEEYELFLADQLAKAEQVILITVASGLNNKGYINAMQAAKNFDNVTVFNSGHLSSGMGLIVRKAALMASEGASMDEITAELTQMREKVSTSFVLQTVENMYQNNRISKNVYQISKALNLHPVLCVRQNQFHLGGLVVGTSGHVYKKYIRKCLRHRRTIDKGIVFVTHAGLNYRQMEAIRKEILKYVPFDVIQFQNASATISVNCGMGTFGLLYLRK